LHIAIRLRSTCRACGAPYDAAEFAAWVEHFGEASTDHPVVTMEKRRHVAETAHTAWAELMSHAAERCAEHIQRRTQVWPMQSDYRKARQWNLARAEYWASVWRRAERRFMASWKVAYPSDFANRTEPNQGATSAKETDNNNPSPSCIL